MAETVDQAQHQHRAAKDDYYRFQSSAIEALQEAAEAYMVGFLSGMYQAE